MIIGSDWWLPTAEHLLLDLPREELELLQELGLAYERNKFGTSGLYVDSGS